MPARSKSIHLHFIPVWILYLQPLLHFLTLPSNFSQRWHFWGLHNGGKGARFGLDGGWGRTVHSSFVIASCIFNLIFGHASSCGRRISATFLWGQILLKLFYKVLRVWIYRFELMVWPHGMSTKITPFASQNEGSWLSLLKE